jgi:2-dehydro-3-deoxygalactonokinase
MRWADGFIAVDWGTTNRRAYRIDHEGTCVSTIEDDLGVLSVAAGGFPAAANDIRTQLGDLPLLMAGMVGSTRGWVEAPYVPCPAGMDDLAAKLSWVEPGRTAIVPGLSILGGGRADVMRGEEVQLFGAIAAGLIPADCFICHPGTHNKWVAVENGRITDFRTVMTGEMFDMLRKRGILAEMLTEEVTPDAAFREGVQRGLSASALTAELFSVRARVLLGDMPRASAASYVSGLLIGEDLSVGLQLAESDIIMMGRASLTRLYTAAAAEAGRASQEIDGSAAFLAGAVAISRKLD